MTAWDYVRFLGGLLIVLGLIAGLAWAARRFDLARLIGAAGPARGQRLAVLESRMIDPRRRLVLVQRDDVAHLIVLGPNSETVVETGIAASASTLAGEAPGQSSVKTLLTARGRP